MEVLRHVLGNAQSSTSDSDKSRSVEGSAVGEIDESLLQRPKILPTFMPASRRLRGPMVLPQVDGDRWDDGDLAAGLDPRDLVCERCDCHYGSWTDVA